MKNSKQTKATVLTDVKAYGNRFLTIIFLITLFIALAFVASLNAVKLPFMQGRGTATVQTIKPLNIRLDIPKAEWVTELTKEELRITFTLVNDSDKTLKLLQENIHIVALTNDNEQITFSPTLEQGNIVDIPTKWGRQNQLSVIVPHKERNIHHYLAMRIFSDNQTQPFEGQYAQFNLMAQYRMMPEDAQKGVSYSETPTATTQDKSLQASIDRFLQNKEVNKVKLSLLNSAINAPVKATVTEINQQVFEVPDEMGEGTYEQTSDYGARCYKLNSDLSIDIEKEIDCHYNSVEYTLWSDDRLSKVSGKMDFYAGTHPLNLTNFHQQQIEKAITTKVFIKGKEYTLISFDIFSFVTINVNGKPTTVRFENDEKTNTISLKILQSLE